MRITRLLSIDSATRKEVVFIAVKLRREMQSTVLSSGDLDNYSVIYNSFYNCINFTALKDSILLFGIFTKINCAFQSVCRYMRNIPTYFL